MSYQKTVNFQQSGAALIVALVLLTMLTTLGVTAMRSNLLDVRIHNNTKSKLVALQCAESALLAGENWIWTETSSVPVPKTTVPDPDNNEVWALGTTALAGLQRKDASWWAGNGQPAGVGTDLIDSVVAIGCSTPPYYIIEVFESTTGMDGNTTADIGTEAIASGSGYNTYFRISAYGVGALETAPVVLQTVYAKPYN